MNYLRYIICSLVFISYSWSHAVVCGHLVNDQDLIAKAQDFPAVVGILTFNSGCIMSIGSGAYVIDEESGSKCIMTARHVFEEAGMIDDVVIYFPDGRILLLQNKSVYYPLMLRRGPNVDRDLAIIRLSLEQQSALQCDPIPVYLDSLSLSNVNEMFAVGYGKYSYDIPNHVEQIVIPIRYDLQRRAGCVKLEQTLYYQGSYIYYSNFFPEEIPLNACIGPGDSGGPVIALINNRYYVIAINQTVLGSSIGLLPGDEVNSLIYGAKCYYLPIVQYANAIRQFMQRRDYDVSLVSCDDAKIEAYKSAIEELKKKGK